jgi:hypothetical protein
MQPAYARRFEGLSETEIDRALSSFAFRNCRPREELLAVLRPRLAASAVTPAAPGGTQIA